MNAITKISSTAWHETPAVAAYLATVTVDDLSLRRPLIVMGKDELVYTGDPVEQLSEMRREVIDALFGCIFREAMAAGRAHQYLDFESDFATADEVLADLFGDPRRFGNEDPAIATHMMRCEAQIKDARQRHGIGEAGAPELLAALHKIAVLCNQGAIDGLTAEAIEALDVADAICAKAMGIAA